MTFSLLLVLTPSRKGRGRSRWLKGDVQLQDLVGEAEALVNDPRDLEVVMIYAWNNQSEQFNARAFRRIPTSLEGNDNGGITTMESVRLTSAVSSRL